MFVQEVLRWCNWKTIRNRSVLQNCLCVEYETEEAYTHKRTHIWQGRRKKQHDQCSDRGWCPSFPMLPAVHFTPDVLFCQKKSTILHVIYHIFRYKTCTGCLEQQQKYNIQFIICHFFSLIIINSIGESSWRLSLWLFGVLSPKWPASHSVGLQGTNKYTGQDVKKKENKKSDYFYYKSRQ